MDFLVVALGSAVGGAGRYAISSIPVKSTFPFMTLLVNVLGAVLIGFITGLVMRRPGISKTAVLFFRTGICGGFTTFSTFSLEAYQLFSLKHYMPAILYILISVIGCLAGVLCGMRLGEGSTEV